MESENEMNVPDELITKYLSGEATPEEALLLMDWMQQPENRLRFKELEEVWSVAKQEKAPVFTRNSAWQKVHASIQESGKTKGRSVSMVSWKTVLVAASLMVAVTSAVLIFIRSDEKMEMLATSSESKVVTLQDQSKVTLYKNSSLQFPVEFKKNTREVVLAQGEAFFEISPNKQKPFVVHTEAADIRVVGTEFNVIVKTDHTEINVREGKVRVYSSHDSVYLTKGQSALIRSGANDIVINEVANPNVWGYATHKLVFKNAEVESVIKDLEKTFPCSISISNQNINKCRLTATFDNDSVDKIVILIAESLNLSVKRNEGTYTLEGEGCP